MVRFAPLALILAVAGIVGGALALGYVATERLVLLPVLMVLTEFLSRSFRCPVCGKSVTYHIVSYNYLRDKPVWGHSPLVPRECECGQVYRTRPMPRAQTGVPQKEHLRSRVFA